MSVASRETITESLALIFRGIAQLQAQFKPRQFTIDGRLVGDIGEVIAALEYEVDLDEVSRAGHDATTSDGRRVQIKATFKESLTFRSTPDLYLGIKLYPDGRHEEVYNGPGQLIRDRYEHRKGVGASLLSFPIGELRRLSARVPQEERVLVRSPISLGTTSKRQHC